MNRFSNSEIADMQMMYGSANGNARLAAKLYAERFPNRNLLNHSVFTRFHQRLRDTGRFGVNRREAGGILRLVSPEDEERILQHFD